MKFERVKKGNLKSLLYDFSFRLFDKDKRLLANVKEATSLMHFPSTVIRSAPHLKTAKAGSAPAPLELSKEGILLGENSDRGTVTRVFMAPEDRLRHFYVIGQTGTGKTNLLKNMIVQDIQNGEGVCMIDPHGSDIQDVLSQVPKSRYEDVIYFDPSYVARPMALNMLEYDVNFPEQKTFVVNELFSIFQKLYGKVPESMGPMFEQYFRNATMLVIDDPESGNTLLEVSRVMSNKAFREMKISKCKNPVIVQFWREVAEKAGGEASLANIVPYITSKFDVFLANEVMRPIIAQEKSSFNFRDIMDNKKILLVNLSKGRLGDINANLIGLIIVGKILMAALSRVDAVGTGKVLPPFYLYIDEFQNITTNSISTILSEARKYKLSLTIAHQFIAQLEEGIRDSVFGNVGSIAAFRVGSEDAEFLEKQFSPVFTAKDIMSIDNY
ncbi:MAG: type IV secretion system DNA-binding domain-containing protein, partial [Candidatus Taylorbacteria bacterium]|nr:type IV secretion system DNA-binding domain-containing protein [Candidatus Taylorbacteria bacterium]